MTLAYLVRASHVRLREHGTENVGLCLALLADEIARRILMAYVP